MAKRNIVILVLVVILFVGGYFVFDKIGMPLFNKWGNFGNSVAFAEYTNNKGEKWLLPKGKYDFLVSSGNEYPKFISGEIDPLDVKVGDIQKMKVVIADTAPMKSVIAEIETDSGIKKVPLRLSNSKSISADYFRNQKYFVDEKGLLVINNENSNVSKNIIEKLIKEANAQSVVEFTYEGEWEVKDTHTRTYHTVFIATNEKGDTDKITLAWSDPVCDFSSDILQSNCIVSSGVEGVDGVSYSLGQASYTITLNGSAKLAYNPGRTLTIGNGKIVIQVDMCTPTDCAGVLNQYIFVGDADGDGYSTSTERYAFPSASQSGFRRLSNSTTTLDCYDSNANAFPGQTEYFGVHRGDNSFDYNCSGFYEKTPDYYCVMSLNDGDTFDYYDSQNTCKSGVVPWCYDGNSVSIDSATCGQSVFRLNVYALYEPEKNCEGVQYTSKGASEQAGPYYNWGPVMCK